MQEIKEIEDTLEIRLKQVIKIYYGNQKQLAESLGIASSTISEWWKGTFKPTATILQKICEDTGVSMDWLVLGRAEPYVDEDLFQDIFDDSKKFAENNDIDFDAIYLLGMQRIIIGEKKMNANITLDQIFTKYKEIILAFRKK